MRKLVAVGIMKIIQEESGAWRGVFLWAVLGALLAPGRSLIEAQSTNRPSDPALMRQLHQAVSLAQHGDRQHAMTLALQLLQRNPKFVPAMKLRAMLLEEAGQTSAAATAYEEALKLAPNDPDLLLKVGIDKLTAGDREQAIQLLQHCTKISPGDGDAPYYLAQAYHLNGQGELALRAIRQSLKTEPDNPSVWQKYGELLCSTGDCRGGLRWLLKAQHADANLPRLDFDIAAAEFQSMDFTAAVQYATRAVEAHPDDANALQLLATANGKLAHWQEAEATFAKLLALKVDDVEILLGLGQCQVELKDYQAAVGTLESVLRLDPTRLLAHFYLSRAFAGMGRTEDAQHEAALHQLMMERLTFVRSLETDRRESPIKAQAQQLLSAHREAETVRLYQEHFKGTSATPADAYVFVGKLYLFMGQTEAGLRCLHHALKIQSTVRGAHTYEGILALKNGDLNEAESEFNAELANDPNDQTAIAELGEVRYHQGRWSEAAEQLAKSHTITPELLFLLCDSYFRMGDTKNANLTAELVAAYGRNNPELMKELKNLLKSNGQLELAQHLGS